MVKEDLRDFHKSVIGDSDRGDIHQRRKALKWFKGLKVNEGHPKMFSSKRAQRVDDRRFDLWMEFLMVHLEELEMNKWL
ncbi:hypothetical protein Tco_0439016 [Tanacetum coccineum]